MTTFLATPADWPRILLARADAPDPLDLDAAVAAGAFTGLRRAIEMLGPAGTIDAVEQSGLRGRGGAGYPTGAKWRTCAATEAARRFVVANGYGADPATFTDQALMERNPYAVIEGLAIAAYAVGASEAVIAVRADYTDAVRILESAVQQAEEAGFVGADVLDSGFELTVTVRPVQGAYMLGEETVLLKAIEGKRGQPEQRPPHPAVTRPVRLPDRRAERCHARERAVDRHAGSRRVRRDRRTGRARNRARPGQRIGGRAASPRSRPAHTLRAIVQLAGGVGVRPHAEGAAGRWPVGRTAPRRGAGHAV